MHSHKSVSLSYHGFLFFISTIHMQRQRQIITLDSVKTCFCNKCKARQQYNQSNVGLDPSCWFQHQNKGTCVYEMLKTVHLQLKGNKVAPLEYESFHTAAGAHLCNCCN